ncbi:hypothetical protein JOF56_000025 [Kibdelosporangium banguiense]|uniref:Uncharacterized protein n=1 Tax=Kibdelosporangium banguiense TaxID=1365924 RepID=A0ABS4T653_9PSEU|nr:hypothetical protein [Kibdelosporangium banguiense]
MLRLLQRSGLWLLLELLVVKNVLTGPLFRSLGPGAHS